MPTKPAVLILAVALASAAGAFIAVQVSGPSASDRRAAMLDCIDENMPIYKSSRHARQYCERELGR